MSDVQPTIESFFKNPECTKRVASKQSIEKLQSQNKRIQTESLPLNQPESNGITSKFSSIKLGDDLGDSEVEILSDNDSVKEGLSNTSQAASSSRADGRVFPW